MKIFIDACCFFAGFASPNGGSALILQFAQAGKLRAVTNETTVEEAFRNLQKKKGDEIAAFFLAFLRKKHIEIMPAPSPGEENQWQKDTHMKDAHVLASALSASVDCVVSLDKKHLLTPHLKKVFPIPIKNPQGFLIDFLKTGS